MLEKLFNQERASLDYFFDNVDIEALEDVFEELISCKGLIILTGVGKSGLVAKKIAATMTSTNTRAIFLSPINALHGDLGIVSKKDVFIFLSKSGESEELLGLIPSLRNKGVKLIAMVCNKNSKLAKACDHVFYLPIDKELCPYNMAPTTSTTVQMLFGDIISMALMEKNETTLEEYITNHPSGSIGKRVSLKVRDLMITGENLPKCYPEDTLCSTLVELSNKRCGCVLVVDSKNKLQGIFTDGDLRRALQENGPAALNKTMECVMSKKPRTVKANLLAMEAIKIMENSFKNEVLVLPVIDDSKHLIGLIKLHDIVQSGIA